MDNRDESQRHERGLSNPLVALLIAAVAAIGAIAQCGLLLDAAAASRSAVVASPEALTGTRVKRAQRPIAATVPGERSSTGADRLN